MSKELRKKYGRKVLPPMDTSQYPQRWGGYVGQEDAKGMLMVAAKSARIRNEPLDHYMIAHSSPGVGKTALGVLVAKELKRPVRMVAKLNLQQARMIFAEMEDGDVLIIDEAHRLVEGGKANAEWLLHYLQDGVLMGPLGPEPQPRITILAITTHPQKIPAAVLDRFIAVPMAEYTTEEAARIAQVMAPRVLGDLPRLTKREAMAIAGASSNNPRAIRKMLQTLRDLTVTKTKPLKNGRYDIDGLLERLHITEDGLTPLAQEYLVALREDFNGSAGVSALEDRLRQPSGLADVERSLMDRGLVARVRTGRTLTQAGIERSRQLAG